MEKDGYVNDEGIYNTTTRDGFDCEFLYHIIPSTGKNNLLLVCHGKDRSPLEYQFKITSGNAGIVFFIYK